MSLEEDSDPVWIPDEPGQPTNGWGLIRGLTEIVRQYTCAHVFI